MPNHSFLKGWALLMYHTSRVPVGHTNFFFFFFASVWPFCLLLYTTVFCDTIKSMELELAALSPCLSTLGEEDIGLGSFILPSSFSFNLSLNFYPEGISSNHSLQEFYRNTRTSNMKHVLQSLVLYKRHLSESSSCQH